MKEKNQKDIAKMTKKAADEFVKAIHKNGLDLSEKLWFVMLGIPNCKSFEGMLTHAYALAATWAGLLAIAKDKGYDFEQLKEFFSIVRDKNFLAFEEVAKEEAKKEEHEQE